MNKNNIYTNYIFTLKIMAFNQARQNLGMQNIKSYKIISRTLIMPSGFGDSVSKSNNKPKKD